ncbi:MAG: hypothetical protein WD648_10155 [Planctomycetaceae bacterium]
MRLVLADARGSGCLPYCRPRSQGTPYFYPPDQAIACILKRTRSNGHVDPPAEFTEPREAAALDRELAAVELPCRVSRKSGRRDHLFLTWYETKGSAKYHSHAKIRDLWDGLQSDPHQRIGGDDAQSQEAGRQLVITAIKRARKERATSSAKSG